MLGIMYLLNGFKLKKFLGQWVKHKLASYVVKLYKH